MKAQKVHQRWLDFIKNTVDNYDAHEQDVMNLLEVEEYTQIKEGKFPNGKMGKRLALNAAIDNAERWLNFDSDGYQVTPQLIARHRPSYIYFCLLKKKEQVPSHE